MIDVHVVEKPGWPVERVIEQVSHPLVTVHVGQYFPGNIYLTRLNGFSKGTNPLVTWIDPDDEVLDVSWLPKAVEWMQDPSTAAVYPRWEAFRGTRKWVCPIYNTTPPNLNKGSYPHAHHLTIMRRSNILRSLGAYRHPDVLQRVELRLIADQQRFGQLRQHPTVAYRWMIRDQ